jgi:hypothetical protein
MRQPGAKQALASGALPGYRWYAKGWLRLMAGVFLSYARFDSELGERIVAGLRSLDVECWWDRDMPGVDWPREIERQIESMSALVVIWTAASKDSKYVRAEAIPAFDREKLVNIMFGVKEPPLPFNLYNGFQLDGWTGRESHDGWTRLVRTLEAKLVKTGEVKQGQLAAALSRREQGVRRRQGALTAAEEAFAAAKAADGESDGELAKARAALTRAEEQLSQVSAMHAGPKVILGAQGDLDDARTGVKDAEAARRAAAAALAGASKALARAKTAVETAFVSPPELESEPAEALDAAAADADDDADAEPDALLRPTPASAARSAPQPDADAAPKVDPSRLVDGLASAAAGAGMAGAAAERAATGDARPGPTPAAGPSPTSQGPTSLGTTTPGTTTPGTTTPGTSAAPAKRSSPLPMLIGGAVLVVVGAFVLAAIVGQHPTPVVDNSGNAVAAADNSSNATAAADNSAAAPASADPLLAAAQAMAGDWGGNGAVCGSNPLTIAVDTAARTVRETLSNTPSVGSLVGLRASDGAVQLSFSGDGHTEYDSVSGDALTLGFTSGSMTYQRCKS